MVGRFKHLRFTRDQLKDCLIIRNAPLFTFSFAPTLGLQNFEFIFVRVKTSGYTGEREREIGYRLEKVQRTFFGVSLLILLILIVEFLPVLFSRDYFPLPFVN